MRARSKSFLIASLFIVALTRTASAESQEPTPAADRTTGHQTRELKCLAARAEPWPQGFVKMTIPGKDDQFIPEQRITKITSADGSDWTHRVIVQRQAVEGENLEVCYNDAYPAVWSLRGHPKAVQEWFPVLQAGTLFKLSPNQVPGDRAGAMAHDGRWCHEEPRPTDGRGRFGLLWFRPGPDPPRGQGEIPVLAFPIPRDRRGARIHRRRLRCGRRPVVFLSRLVGELSFSMGDWMVVTGQVETRSVTGAQNFALDSGGSLRSAYRTQPQEDTFTSWSLGAKFGGGFSLPALFVSAFIVGSLMQVQGSSF